MRDSSGGDLGGLLLEDPDELGADRLALGLGLGDAFELLQEALLGVDGHQRHLEGVPESADHLLALVLAHQAVVDEHASELVADRAVHEQGRHRRVDTTGEAADDAPVPDLLADASDLIFGDRGRRPGPLAAAYLSKEAGEDLLPVGRVHHLGVELDAIDAALAVLYGRDRRGGGGGERSEAGGRLEDGVAVGHPAGLLLGHSRQQYAWLGNREVGAAELAHLSLLDASAQLVDEQLHAVANAEHRHPQARADRAPGEALPGAYTDAGPPERTIPRGLRLATSSKPT